MTLTLSQWNQPSHCSRPAAKGSSNSASPRARLLSLKREPLLEDRVDRLSTIPGAGLVTSLTWALEAGDISRSPNIKHLISYCGLCSGQDSSAGVQKRSPISKQRNKHLQTVLVEAANLAPRWNPDLARIYDQEKQRGNHNRATLAVARKLVSYLLAVDRWGSAVEIRSEEARAA
ncbi:transposase [Bryobacter aggregatus]|uniref:transposase n=1 Tax=Bryobacter aggregatus TaxID=360054 RepID=UPI00138E19E5|nr:transposase [Bryobacter aggregatus]